MLQLSVPRRILLWKEPVPFGLRRSKSARAAKVAAKDAVRRERRELQVKHKILLEGKPQFKFSLIENFGIGYTRAAQVMKHLEMHEAAPPPRDLTPIFRDKVLKIVELVKKERIVNPARVLS